LHCNVSTFKREIFFDFGQSPKSKNLLLFASEASIIQITDVTHTQILYLLFAALRQNRVPKNIFGRSFIFAPKAQK
jgi:hypothetical protein